MAWHLDRESLLKAVKGDLLQKGDFQQEFSGVETDSRKPMSGHVFFALKGPFFDGHDFLREAFQQGAAGLVIHGEKQAREFLSGELLNRELLGENSPEKKSSGETPTGPAGRQKDSLSVIKVPDTLKALQDLAVFWRKKLNLKIAAVTGSNGKTTVKSFAKTLMSSLPALASPKSCNNHWGVPLSLLSASEPNSVLIQEIGTSRPGEIAALTALCEPAVSAVTMAGPSHLEGFGSVDSVAEEKKQIYLQSRGAVWVFNRDNPWTEKMFQDLSPMAQSFLSFSAERADADIRFCLLRDEAGASEIEGFINRIKGRAAFPFSGKINRDNLMCACGLALGAGVSPEEIWSQLPRCRLPAGRQQWFYLEDPKPLSVLFDGYNANPASMEAFLTALGKAAPPAKRFLVLGDMKELGESSARRHRALAEHPALFSSPFIWHIGEAGGELEEALKGKNFRGKFVWTKAYRKADLSLLARELKNGDFVGIKGSRSLKLERLLFDLTGQKSLLNSC